MSAGTKELLSDVIGGGAGVIAWMKTSTKKFNETGQTFQRVFEDALANTIGKNAVQAIDPAYNGPGDLAPKLTGFLNKTTGAGILLLIADAIGQKVPKYRQLDGLHDIVEKAGWGVLIGGVVGGVFDPASTGPYPVQTVNPGQGVTNGSSGGVVAGNVPFGRAAGGAPASVSVLV